MGERRSRALQRHTLDRMQIPAWHAGEMDRRRSRYLQYPMLGGQCDRRMVDVRLDAPASALVDDRRAPRLQGMWCRGLCEHRSELARQGWQRHAVHEAVEGVTLAAAAAKARESWSA
jgi:hypothetical protein